MGNRIYIGNVSFETNEDNLRAALSEDGRGVKEVNIITDRETGRPRGFAFAEMANDADALAAIKALDGRDLDGRALTVNEAKERAPRSGGGGGGGGGHGGGGGGRDRW